MSNIFVRKMSLDDLEKINSIGLENFDDFWNINTLRSELSKSDINTIYFIATNNCDILGFIGALRIIDELNIMNIAVRKDLRRCGVGSALLEFLINFAISQKDGSITLEVNENNTSAIELYKKYNFKQVGLRKKYYNNTDNAILMSLYLKKEWKTNEKKWIKL